MQTHSQETQATVQDFLKQHPMAVLSTVAEDGSPWGSAIYCVADEDYNFFFVTRADTRKYRSLEQNPQAALTIADTDSQFTVQVTGVVSKVPARDTVDVVFKKLAAIKPKGDVEWIPPVIKIHKGDWMILKLTPTLLQFADYKAQKTSPYEEYIEVLIPRSE